jgi:hypothetical protein
MLAALLATACGAPTSGPDGGATGGSIQFTASGEVLALGGYAFPPATAGDPAFVDGWEVTFTKVLATIDHITLSENPDTSPSDQSQIGSLVAQVDGPWAIDLHKGGALVGKGGTDEQAYPLATLDNQNKNGGKPFDPTVRYAFGFDLVPASATATRLQLDAADPDYAEMVQNGWTVLYVGTAKWKGGAACSSTDSSFDFTKLPQTVNFHLGFKSPTTYVNCMNPDNDPAKGVGGEEHQRGVQVKQNQTVVAQVTVHTDHPFWESFTHDTPPHFDQMAALAQTDGGVSTFTMSNAVGVNYTAFSFGNLPLPWRACLSTYSPPNTNPQMGFDSLTIPYNPSGSAASAMRDYADYLVYNQSTQGHLNSDGLCFVQRHYPSPP